MILEGHLAIGLLEFVIRRRTTHSQYLVVVFAHDELLLLFACSPVELLRDSMEVERREHDYLGSRLSSRTHETTARRESSVRQLSRTFLGHAPTARMRNHTSTFKNTKGRVCVCLVSTPAYMTISVEAQYHLEGNFRGRKLLRNSQKQK